MLRNFMDLYGETPDEPARECYGCGRMEVDGECLNADCKLCERVCPYCDGTTIDKTATEDDGSCCHCFGGIVK